MIASQDHRVVVWIEGGVLLLLVAFLGLHTMPRAWSKLNTDFPNYYMSARLAHEGFDTAREYEWVWLEREKDHRAVDIRVIGLLPITPFSTLVMWPLTGLSPLAAKHAWILANLALLIPLGWLLRSITGLSYRRIALVFALCFPLHRNLLFGQFYVVLLLLLVGACWAYQRGLHALAGALVAIAAACKIFPVVLFVFFLRRGSWRALISGAATGAVALAVSVAVFGWNLHRTYLHQILPWSLHGEGLPPYATASASISSVLHYLFLAEPQWNPHPWHNSPLCYALLQPTLQMLALAPAVLLIRKSDRTPGRIALEWSALITASLAISTSPASYHFVLMVLPLCVLASLLLERKWYGWLAILLIVYIGICLPIASPSKRMGPAILLYVPRLPLMLALLLGIYVLLWRDGRSLRNRGLRDIGRTLIGRTMPGQPGWPLLRCSACVPRCNCNAPCGRSTPIVCRSSHPPFLTQTRALPAGGSATSPSPRTAITFCPRIRMSGRSTSPRLMSSPSPPTRAISGWRRREVRSSQIVSVQEPGRVFVDDAREPMLSADGRSIAFIRDDHGRGRLMLRTDFRSGNAIETALTPAALNVYEASFRSKDEYAFSAVENGSAPQIYLTDATHANGPLALGESRFPALSPDGAWMAYSHLDRGVWNLWLRDQRSGATRRIADIPCNQMQPAWEDDSKTLLYGADCGRSLWFTAISRRRVIP